MSSASDAPLAGFRRMLAKSEPDGIRLSLRRPPEMLEDRRSSSVNCGGSLSISSSSKPLSFSSLTSTPFGLWRRRFPVRTIRPPLDAPRSAVTGVRIVVSPRGAVTLGALGELSLPRGDVNLEK